MSSQNRELSTRSLADLALIVSRVARNLLEESTVPSAASLRLFWECSRSLELQWTKTLDEWTDAGKFDIAQLERLAPRVFACELVVRTWSTVLARLDLQCHSRDLTTLARNVVNGLLRVRNRILSRLLSVPEVHQTRVLRLDRLRRRFDRWTDLLVGQVALNCDCVEFAFNRDRARDFGEDATLGSAQIAAEQFVCAGLRLAFVQHLASEPVRELEFVGLSQSILTNIPHWAMHRDGSLRTLLEQQIAASRRRSEGRPVPSVNIFDKGVESPHAIALGGSFFLKKPIED